MLYGKGGSRFDSVSDSIGFLHVPLTGGLDSSNLSSNEQELDRNILFRSTEFKISQ